MPRSMTGFGVADGPLAGGRIHVEIRTVNHRHFNVQMRFPAHLQPHEESVRTALRARIERGHVTVSARWTQEPEAASQINVDLERARVVVDALTRLKTELALPGEIDVGFVARQPDVLVHDRPTEIDVPAEELLGVLDAALADVVAMREREGEALATDLRGHLATIATRLSAVAERAPLRVTETRDRLQAAVGELLEGRPVSEDRLAQEIAFLAERLDISEEMVRLETHVAAARAALAGEAPSGRTLGFLSQEILREINTIGSKANDAEIAAAVVGMKSAVEKLREQIENVE